THVRQGEYLDDKLMKCENETKMVMITRKVIRLKGILNDGNENIATGYENKKRW
ncbi:hypothetical protein PanWU01x14_134170, partial [Parasponia andersonii]